MVELYEFIPCYPGLFGINCMLACHCDASCICDPVVGCINCEQNTECDAIHKTPPQCQGIYAFNQFSFGSQTNRPSQPSNNAQINYSCQMCCRSLSARRLTCSLPLGTDHQVISLIMHYLPFAPASNISQFPSSVERFSVKISDLLNIF